MNGNMIPEEWKENFRTSQRSFYIFMWGVTNTQSELTLGLISSYALCNLFLLLSFAWLPIVAGYHRQSTEILTFFLIF